MSVKLRTLTTAALAFALAAGLASQVAVAQPAYATEASIGETNSTDAQSGADGQESGRTETGGAEAGTGSNGAATGGTDGSNAAGTDANGAQSTNGSAGSSSEAAAAANGDANAAGEPGNDPDPQEPSEPSEPGESEGPVQLKLEEPGHLVPFADLNAMSDNTNLQAAASGLPSAGFKAGYIVSDANMYDGASMTAAQIQSFLNQQVSRCTIGDPGRKAGAPAYDANGKYLGVVASHCLKDLRITTKNQPANSFCNAYSGASNESAAQIIAKVGAACGISPKVLLVRLQLEQSLILDTWPTVRQYSFAMGWNCPDSGPGNSANCNNGSAGFLDQVYGSAWQVKRYKALPNEYRYKAHKVNKIQWNPNVYCGTSDVLIENQATAALYIYTPYRPNQSALNAGWGASKDTCATYGNRNFYQYYRAWFGAPNSYFPDVQQGHKFFKEIEWMGESGLSTGVRTPSGKLYRPKAEVTREAMAAFLYRLEKANYKGPATSPFADMKPGDKFYNEISWMYETGLSTGIKQPSGKPIYAPKENVSREAMAAFIYRLQDAKYSAPKASPFADMKFGDKFYREITWMYDQKLSTGIKQPSGKPKYAPKDRVSREAMAAFIYRMEH